MIIYRRKDNDVVIPCGLGPVVCPDTSHNLQMKTVDSSTVLQHVEPDSGYYGLYRVIVNPIYDANLLAENIKNGVTILGVMGTYAGELINLQYKWLNWADIYSSLTQVAYIYPDEGYDGLSAVRLTLPKTGRCYVVPSTSAQTLYPSLGKDFFTAVDVAAVTADIDPDILAENIKKDVEILGVVGTFEGGPLQSKSVNSSTGSQSVTPDPSYYGLSQVTVSPYTVEGKSQTITQNGTYTFAPTSADALSDVSISVQVAGIPATVQAKSVSYNVNGEYTVTPDQGYDGLSSVDISVNVPAAQPTLQTKTVNSSTASQTVQSDGGYDGLSEVIVNPYTVEADSSTLTQNGTYSFSPVNADALSGVTVNVSVDGGQVINNQNKTVNSSTSSQSVTADNGYTGLGTVTVNPYTLDTKTVNPSTNSITVNSSADGMSSVTVNAVTASIDPDILAENIKKDVEILGVVGIYEGASINNQNKTVNPSTNSQSITADQGYTGLGTVTVNPMNLENKFDNPYTYSSSYVDVTADSGYNGLSKVRVFRPKNDSITVNSSTVAQEITPASRSTDYFNKVTVNPYTVESDSSTLTANGTYTFTPQSADALSSVTIDVSVDSSAGSDWYTEWKLGNKHDLSDVDLTQVMTTYRGLYYMFNDDGNPTPRYMSAPPVMDGSSIGRNGMSMSFYGVIFTNQNGTEISFPNLTTLNNTAAMYNAFHATDGITKISFPELTSINALQAMQGFFSEQTVGTLTEIYMPKLQNVSGQYAVSSWVDDYVTGMASRKLTIHPAALKYSVDDNVAYWMGNSLTDLVLSTTTERDIILENNPNLTAESVMNVLNAMAVNPTPDPELGYPICTFYSYGITVMDYQDGRIQSRYNALLSGGWDIVNLTITPYSA